MIGSCEVLDHLGGQDADLIGGDLASLAMTGVVGECFSTCRVQPMQHPLHSHPRLIGSHHFCCAQGLLDLLFRLDESVCSFCDEGFQRSRREVATTHVCEQFSRSCIGQQLFIQQIHSDPFEHWSILH